MSVIARSDSNGTPGRDTAISGISHELFSIRKNRQHDAEI